MKALLFVAVLSLACGSPPPDPPPHDAGCLATEVVYPDADGDGFGDFLSPGVVSCVGRRPAGHVLNRDDCGDTDARAHPGQAAWQTTPINGFTNYWDFDCDGVLSVQYPSAPQPCFNGGSSCIGTVGSGNYWLGNSGSSPPSCGVVGSWVNYCRPTVSACQPDTAARTQGCR